MEVNCEAVAIGTTFEVSAGEGVKKRYYVEHIEANAAPDTPFLAYFSDSTDLQILDGPLRSPINTNARRPFQLDARKIGGLHKQVEELNQRLRMLCCRARTMNLSPKLVWNRGILIHGFEGTGKTLLLNELAKVVGLRRILRLKSDQLLNTPTKNNSIIESI